MSQDNIGKLSALLHALDDLQKADFGFNIQINYKGGPYCPFIRPDLFKDLHKTCGLDPLDELSAIIQGELNL